MSLLQKERHQENVRGQRYRTERDSKQSASPKGGHKMKTTRMTPKEEALLPAVWQEVNRVIIQYFVLRFWNLSLGHLLE